MSSKSLKQLTMKLSSEESCALLIDEARGFVFLPLKLREMMMKVDKCSKLEWDGDCVMVMKKRGKKNWVEQLNNLLSKAEVHVDVLEAKKDTLVLPGTYMLFWKIRLEEKMEDYMCVKRSETSHSNWQSILSVLNDLSAKFAEDDKELQAVDIAK